MAGRCMPSDRQLKQAPDHRKKVHPQGYTRVGDANNYPTRPASRRQPGNVPPTPWVCVCRKSFETEKGMNIHKGRMKCGQLLSQDLRKGKPNNTVEEPDQENHHSVWSLTDTNSASAPMPTVGAANERTDDTAVNIIEVALEVTVYVYLVLLLRVHSACMTDHSKG